VRHAYPAYRPEALPPRLSDLVAGLGAEAPSTRVETLDTVRGRLLLRDLCPPSLIERLHPDPGLAAFTRRPEREHAILMRTVQTGHGSVAVAHNATGAIVGDVVISNPSDWWEGLDGVYELSIETSREWRRLGIARALLDFCMRAPWIEQVILVAMGLDWHWDLQAAGLDADAYGVVLRSLLEKAGFVMRHTSEPNIAMHRSNVLLVRTGAKVSPERRAALHQALYIAPWQREAVSPEAPVGA
jgi:GNAT superfamily N-acetyltransferase